MSGSVVVDVAIGLVFVFLVSSLICSGIVEAVANLLNMRGDFLLQGLREMLDRPPAVVAQSQPTGIAPSGQPLAARTTNAEVNKLAIAGIDFRNALSAAAPVSVSPYPGLSDLVLSHPIVAALQRPGRSPSKTNLPSYLSGQTFARALLDLLVPDGAGNTTITIIQTTVDKLDDNLPAKTALQALLRDAGDSVARFRIALEHWYDEQMARVSGWYKRWAQWRLLFAGITLAILANVNAFNIGRTLYHDQPVRQAVVAQALSAQACPADGQPGHQECLNRQRQVLRDLPLPIGWDLGAAGRSCQRENNGATCDGTRRIGYALSAARRGGLGAAALTLLGWLLTGGAVSLGAPFWFDALGKLGSLRSTGARSVPAASR